MHTTELGEVRIKRNLSLEVEDIVSWCKTEINSPNAVVIRKGKNWYVHVDDNIITVNANSYTIITAHKERAFSQNAEDKNMESKTFCFESFGARSFDSQRIAGGYAKDRPFLHKQVMELLRKDLHINGNFQKGLDIGCGAGLSTRGLRLICDKVVGVDISDEMIAAAQALYKDASYTFLKSSAEEIKAPAHSFDVATAAGVVNWVDEKRFLLNLRPLMQDKGILIVYDFWITDKMKGNDAYTRWWHDKYLREFPKPPRKENIWTQEMTLSYGFTLNNRNTYTLEYDFDKDAFIKFMLVQSNVNVQIEEGGKTVGEVRDWFDDTLKDVFRENMLTDGKETIIFEGYYWNFLASDN